MTNVSEAYDEFEPDDKPQGMECNGEPIDDTKPRTWWQTRYVDSSEVLSVHGEWKEPLEEVALARYHKLHTHHAIYTDTSSTRTIDLKVFGQGHMLYFYFIKYMAMVFGALSIFPAFIAIILFLNGSWFTTGSLEKTSIGNYGLVSTTNGTAKLGYLLSSDPTLTAGVDLTSFSSSKNAEMEIAIGLLFRGDANKDPATIAGSNKRTTIIAMSWLDLLGCIGFFCSSLYFIVWTRRLAQRADDMTVTIKDYSVRVQGLPSDVTEEEVKRHFEQWGEVARVDLAHACYDFIDMVMERKDITAAEERALAVLQRSAITFPRVDEELETEVLQCRFDLVLINRAIRAQQAMHGAQDVVEAFVVYKEETSRATCVFDQPRHFWNVWKEPMENRFRGQHQIKITQAPEPTDVIFENLELNWVSRARLWISSWSMKCTLLVIGFFIISIAPAIQTNLGAWKGRASQSNCNAYCTYTSEGGVPTLNDTLSSYYQLCHTTGTDINQLSCGNQVICFECFCHLTLSTGSLTNLNLCFEFNSVLLIQVGAQTLAVVTIVLVNIILPRFISLLSALERHHTRSSEARSTTQALLIMYFLNTAISIMVANTSLPLLHNAIKDTWLGTFLLLGIYSDLTPNWYAYVGKSLMLSQMLGIASRLAETGFYIYMYRRKIKNRWKSLTQRELNKSYEGPHFDLASRYGEHLGVVFVCMLYGSAMPIMFFICLISFSATYHLEKYYMLQVCQWPITYSANLPIFVSSTLPFAALWHVLFALWVFSMIAVPQSGVAGSSIVALCSSISRTFEKVWQNTNGLSTAQMAARLAQGNALHFLGGLFFLIASLLVFWFLDPIVKALEPLVTPLLLKFLGRNTIVPAQSDGKKGDKDGSDGNGPLEDGPQEDKPWTVSDYPSDPVQRRGDSATDQAGKAPLSATDKLVAAGVKLQGIPEFDVAVRSQLLVGPATYLIEDVPAYDEAFSYVEEEKAGRADELKAKLKVREAREGKNPIMNLLKDKKRKALREKADRLAQTPLSKPEIRAALATAGDQPRAPAEIARAEIEPEPVAQASQAPIPSSPSAGWHPENNGNGSEPTAASSRPKKSKKSKMGGADGKHKHADAQYGAEATTVVKLHRDEESGPRVHRPVLGAGSTGIVPQVSDVYGRL